MNPTILLYPIASVTEQAIAAMATLAGSKLLLFKTTLSPEFGTTLSQVLAAEADFSGYPPGGVTLAAFQGPVLAPGRGAAIFGPPILFARDGTMPGVSNLIRGWALVTAGNVLWAVGTFPQDLTFQVPGQGISIPLAFGFPSG